LRQSFPRARLSTRTLMSTILIASVPMKFLVTVTPNGVVPSALVKQMILSQKLKKAFRNNTGTKLTPEEVRELLKYDDLINSVYETHQEYFEDKERANEVSSRVQHNTGSG